MRRRLVAYFDRKNCRAPDELADETLNRVARKLEEIGAIESETPAKYCYITARFVFLEYLRNSRKDDQLFDDARWPAAEVAVGSDTREERAAKEKLLSCLEQCTGKLEPRNQEIITRYYLGSGRSKIENRGSLASELGITVNALSIRACRIRDKLEVCVRRCAGTE
jgi:DNA-directed RNA polymerase specialized sigma24 family protein